MLFFSTRTRGAVAAVVIATTALTGCTTTGGASFASQTAMDRAIGQCVASVVISAGIGALAGAAIGGGRSAGRGALVGGAVGVGACAVLMQIAAAEDRARIRQEEENAVAANASRTSSFSSKNGKHVAVTTKVTNAPVPTPRATGTTSSTEKKEAAAKPQFTACRYAEQTVNVEGQAADGGRQLWCRLDTGDWKPIAS